MDGNIDHHVEQNKQISKSQTPCFHSYAESRPKMQVIKIVMEIGIKREPCWSGNEQEEERKERVRLLGD
jgi:hypothetical protein